MEIIREHPAGPVLPDTLVLGDCLSVLPLIPDASVQLVLTDPPYGVTHCKWDQIVPFADLWKQFDRVLADNGTAVIFSCQPFTSKLIDSNIRNFKYCWYWEKEKGTGFLNARKQPMRAIEEVCVFYRKQPTYNPQMIPLDKPRKHNLAVSTSDMTHKVKSAEEAMASGKTAYKVCTHAYPTNVLKFSRGAQIKRLHPTQKPLALVEYLIRTHSNEGDVVLDCFLGSGTTALACKNTKRRAIGVEMDAKYFDITLSRLELT